MKKTMEKAVARREERRVALPPPRREEMEQGDMADRVEEEEAAFQLHTLTPTEILMKT